MPQEAIVRIDYPDETFVEKTFDDFVILVIDPTFISASSRLFWNRLHPVEEPVLTDLADEGRRRSGLDIEVVMTTSGELDALDVPLTEREKLSFLAGRPIWQLQGFFTTNGVGKAQVSHFNSGFNAWLAALTALFRSSLVQAFRNDDRRYPPLRGGDQRNLARNVREILARALGYEPDTQGNYAARFLNAYLRQADGSVMEFETLARLNMKSAEMRGRYAINQLYDVEKPVVSVDPETGETHTKRGVTTKSRAHTPDGRPSTTYADAMATVAREAAQFEALRGAPLDPFALAAWQVHVLTVVRLAASAAMALDQNRGVAMKELRVLMRTYDLFRGLADPDAAMLTEKAALRAQIVARCQEFHDRRATSLPSCNPQDLYALVCVFDNLNTVTLAFYTGIDIRDFDSGIAAACDSAAASLIESAIWAGRLQRERIAQMTPTVAQAVLSIAAEADWEGDDDGSLRRCRDLVFSCLTENSWPVLLETAHDVRNTGRTRTVCFHLAIHGERLGEHNPGHFDREPALPSRSRLANIPRADRAEEEYFRFDNRLGMMMTVARPVDVTGFVTALPPLYSEEWQGRWAPAEAALPAGVVPIRE